MSTIEVAFPVIPAEMLEVMWEVSPTDTLTLTTQGKDFMTLPILFKRYPRRHGEDVVSEPVLFEIVVKRAHVDGWHAMVRNVYLTGPWGGRTIHAVEKDSIECTLKLHGDDKEGLRFGKRSWWRR